MAQSGPADISAILAALQAQQSSGTPSQSAQQHAHPPPGMPFSPGASAQAHVNSPGAFQLPAPTQVGNLDLSKIQPSTTGHLDLQDALAHAAATRGRDDYSARPYSQTRDRSRSPARRDTFRDGHNPYRDERRDDSRRAASGRDRSRSPGRPTSGANSRHSDSGSETITVDSSAVGLIIGRAGENMRRIESESGARVQFITGPESSGPRRQCRVSGTAAQRHAAIRDIFRAAEQNQSKQAQQQHPARQQALQSTNLANAKDGEETDQIMVPDRTVGLIIGRGGETIRDLQERSACHVNILGENRSVNGMRPVNLIGSIEAADVAKKMIYEIVESDTRGAPNSQPPQQPPRRDHAPPAAPMPNPYDPYAGSYNPYATSTDKVTASTVVPSEAVGMIIGKGGETIKDMQNASACKINVSQPSGADIERHIELIGTAAAIEHAKRLIWDKVNTVREKQGGLTRGPEAPNPYAAGGYGQPLAAPAPYDAPGPQHPGMPPAQHGAPQMAPSADPYAPYGGYHNYVAMWRAASAYQGPGGMPSQPQ